jgi:Flp pilus assembly protein TadG
MRCFDVILRRCRVPLRSRLARVRSDSERGAVLIFVSIFLAVGIAFAAFVIDLGWAWVVKRKLQASADAAALAGAHELSNSVAAEATARAYSASPGGKNHDASFPTVTTAVEFYASNTKIRVTQSADSPLFFAKLFRDDPIHVKASAVASKTSTVTGTPIAVYVHELCGNKGLQVGGDNATIEGGIHSNGNFEIKNPGFEAASSTTIYRAPFTGPPAQNSASLCKTSDQSDSVYQGGAATDPTIGDYRPWVTPYHSPDIVKAAAPCTHTPSGDVKFENVTLTPAQEGVYCLAPGKKFTVAGNVNGKITVLADIIEAGGTGKLSPYCATEGTAALPATCNEQTPILFYNTGGAPFPAGPEAPTTASKEIIVNPSQAYDWVRYIINRRGGIVINAAGVTSPLRGLLEAEWIDINGENFTMIGTAPDSPAGSTSGGVALEE